MIRYRRLKGGCAHASQVHGSCETVVTRYRPVPLDWYFGFAAGGSAHLLPLFSGKGRALNSALRRSEPEKYIGVDWGRWDHLKSSKFRCRLNYRSCMHYGYHQVFL